MSDFVRRAPRRKPTKVAIQVVDGRTMGRGAFRRATVGKAVANDAWSEFTPRQKRGAIYAAGSTPLVGGTAAALTAARLAPPDQRRQAYATQYGVTTGSALGGAAIGGLAAGEAARRSPRFEHGVHQLREGVARTKLRTRAAVGRPVHYGPKQLGRLGRLTRPAVEAAERSRYGHVLPAVGAGIYAGKTLGGTVGGQTAITLNQRRERRSVHAAQLAKAELTAVQDDHRKLARKKRIAATATTTTGLTGLGSLGALALKRPKLQTGLLTAGAAVGGANSLNFAGVLRREAKREQDKVPTAKRDDRTPLKINISDSDVHGYVHRYGATGTLPTGLNRDERVKAYQARYVHAGGHKGEAWNRRARVADDVRTAGLAVGTVAAAGVMARRSPMLEMKAAKVARKLHPKLVRFPSPHKLESTALGAAVGSGAAELAGNEARRRRARYSNAPAGVAASALRRMQDYPGSRT